MSDQQENKEELLELAHIMKREWDERACLDAKWFINTLRFQQSEEEFDRSGAIEVERILEDDLGFLTQRRDPKSLRLLEVGCGLGRMTRHLAKIFGEVVGTDVSGEMIRQARQRLFDLKNVQLHETNGVDLAPFPDESFDLILAARVFQHVPSPQIIGSNISEAWRVLKPGCIFRFQTNSLTSFGYEEIEKDTWTGASFSESEIRHFARKKAALLISIYGVDTLSCWTTIRKCHLPRSVPLNVELPQIEYYGRTSDPQIKTIPTRGADASLTLCVSGLDCSQVDCNSIAIELNERIILPRYTGPVGHKLEGYLRDSIAEAPDRLTQIEFSIPGDTPSGLLPLRFIIGDKCSDPINIEFKEDPPIPPKICSILNAYDNGADIHARGEKSKLRILVEGLNEAADTGNVRVQIGERIVRPSFIGFMTSRRLYEVDAQLPEGVTSGPTQLCIYFGNLQSPSEPLEIKY
ncbi:MAG: class I SAM-dependent methyltransferase [Acidobacteria bacterium]|nr:class I SAM-dependent methyltransferase [Acidobacteriota bacterium]